MLHDSEARLERKHIRAGTIDVAMGRPTAGLTSPLRNTAGRRRHGPGTDVDLCGNMGRPPSLVDPIEATETESQI